MTTLPYAQDSKYWQTGTSAPDRWIEKALAVIAKMGGEVTRDAYGRSDGHAAYMVEFILEDRPYRIVWPVLPCKPMTRTRSRGKSTGYILAAKRQAATALYHHLDAMFVAAYTLTAARALFSYLVLPSGQTAADLTVAELQDHRLALE